MRMSLIYEQSNTFKVAHVSPQINNSFLNTPKNFERLQACYATAYNFKSITEYNIRI